MLQPYLVLGLDPQDPTLDDNMARRRYLQLVRQYPPTTHGTRFAKIHAAYTCLQTRRARLTHAIFSAETDTRLVPWMH